MGPADAAPASTGLDAQSYADIVERASDAVVVCDDRGKVLWANETVTRILGWDRDDLIGRPVEVLVPSVAKERHRAHRTAFTSAPVSRPMGAALTLVAVRADGSELPVEISLTDVRLDGWQSVSEVQTELQLLRDRRLEQSAKLAHKRG